MTVVSVLYMPKIFFSRTLKILEMALLMPPAGSDSESSDSDLKDYATLKNVEYDEYNEPLQLDEDNAEDDLDYREFSNAVR